MPLKKKILSLIMNFKLIMSSNYMYSMNFFGGFIHTHTQKVRYRERQRETHTERQTHKHTDRDRETETKGERRI